MNEEGIIQYARELYPEGCLVTLFVEKDNVRVINTENANLRENE